MQPHRPSRRPLLLGVLAGRFGWRAAGQAATPATPPGPAPAARQVRRRLVHCTRLTFDACGNCIAVQHLPPYWEEVPDVVVIRRGPITTYTYY
jgi:hypothetical protein